MNVFCPRMFRKKRLGAEQTRFFTVRERKQECVFVRSLALQKACDFESRRDARTVVTCAGCIVRRVVVRDHEHCRIAFAGDPRKNVFDASAHREVRIAADGALDLNFQSKLFEPLDQSRLDQLVGTAAHGVRCFGGEQMDEFGARAGRRELLCRRIRTNRCRRTKVVGTENADANQQQ